MSSNPYENEPGFENAHSSEDKKNIAHYVAKVVSVCLVLIFTENWNYSDKA